MPRASAPRVSARWLLLLPALALGLRPAAGVAPAPEVSVPRIDFTTVTLANGLHVVFSEDHALPVVTECMIFDVGSRDEHRGRSGFAHLFEHLMFEGSKDAPKGVFDKIVEGYGGNDNASTHVDYTYYYETVPSNVLPAVLWLDADRMSALDVTAANMKNQIAVVEEEKRMRVDNAPYGKLMYEELGGSAFANWQNAHSVIGSNADLDAATLADVKTFFDTYYAPRNATLVLVGDFETAKIQATVNQYFGWIPNRDAITPVATDEAVQTAEKNLTVHDPLAKLPATVFAWQGPKRNSPDFYALTMLGQLLFDGDSSLLYQALVKDHPVALQVDGGLGFPNSDFTDYRDPGLFSALIVHKPDATADQLESLVYQQIQQVEAGGVSAADLERIKTKFGSEWIDNEQTTSDRGELLALAALFDKSPEAANSELQKFLDVSNDDLQRAARTFLVKTRSTVIEDVPGPEPQSGEAAKGGRQ